MLNLPNSLTLIRFALLPVYIVTFYGGHLRNAFIIILLAGLTDGLDGYLARTRGQITQIGTMLDPLADKMLMIIVILSLLWSNMIPWSAAVAIFVRDIGMIAGSAFFHFRGKKTVPANAMGKITTVLYYFAILFLFLHLEFAVYYLWFVIIFSFVTSYIYIAKFKIINQRGFK